MEVHNYISTVVSSQTIAFNPKRSVSFASDRRLRLDFPLITGREIEGQFWWILTWEQRDEILNFTRRNGLKLIEE